MPIRHASHTKPAVCVGGYVIAGQTVAALLVRVRAGVQKHLTGLVVAGMQHTKITFSSNIGIVVRQARRTAQRAMTPTARGAETTVHNHIGAGPHITDQPTIVVRSKKKQA